MARWKRLTDVGGDDIDVNMEQVAHMQRIGDTTEITFAGVERTLSIKQTPDEIHAIVASGP